MEIWHDYALKIQSGEIVACKKIKLAVSRYFDDLANPAYFFDESAVNKFLAFSRYYVAVAQRPNRLKILKSPLKV